MKLLIIEGSYLVRLHIELITSKDTSRKNIKTLDSREKSRDNIRRNNTERQHQKRISEEHEVIHREIHEASSLRPNKRTWRTIGNANYDITT